MRTGIALGILGLLCATSANATLINPGFESGLTGWTTAGSAAAVTTHSPSYSPQEGSSFLRLFGTASQAVSLSAGQMLSGWAAFDWNDYSPYLDYAAVRIYGASGLLATPWYENGSGQPSGWDGPWTEWSFTAATAGTYTLQYSAGNTGDSIGAPYGLFDAKVQVPVPEPTTLALMGLGLAGIGWKRRKAA